jgi:hypothetical protein
MIDRYRGAASDDRSKLLRSVIGIANQDKHCGPGPLTLASRAFLKSAALVVQLPGRTVMTGRTRDEQLGFVRLPTFHPALTP